MLKQSPLGQATVYVETYSPELLFPISRALARTKINMEELPFMGVDIWTGYELSWLNTKGKPEIAMAEFRFPCTSPNVIESKSFKLYLNSFNQSRFDSLEDVKRTMKKDLSEAAGEEISIKLAVPFHLTTERFEGICLDALDVEIDNYEVNQSYLHTIPVSVEETLFTNLLKSNCLATGQPDWGSLLVRYAGPRIAHEGLLKYFISFRRHAGFAEHCVEQIYSDILKICKPSKLTVYARYTRRGGLDINPFRSNFEQAPVNAREFRQ